MDRKVTIKLCSSVYEAWETSQWLAGHHIMVLPNGANSEQPTQGIPITVYETDAERAVQLIEQLENKHAEVRPRCPYCGKTKEEKRWPLHFVWRIKTASLLLAVLLTTAFAALFSLLFHDEFLPLWGKLIWCGAVGLLVGCVKKHG